MADDRKQINVDFSRQPELLDALEILATELGTDKSKLVRQFIAMGIEITRETMKSRKKFVAKIPEVKRIAQELVKQ